MTGAPLTLRIGTLRIVAQSGIEAHRLAEALPAALGRALSGEAPPPGRASAADRAADCAAAGIVAAARRQLSDGAHLPAPRREEAP